MAHDIEALEQVRILFDFLPLNNREKPPVRPVFDDPARLEMRLDMIPDSATKPYELIHALADESDFFEIPGSFAKNIITGFIRMDGRPDHRCGCRPAGSCRLPRH